MTLQGATRCDHACPWIETHYCVAVSGMVLAKAALHLSVIKKESDESYEYNG